jgi:maltose O-acetyltransferase
MSLQCPETPAQVPVISQSGRLRLVEMLLGRLPPFTANRVRTAALRWAGVRLCRTSLFWGWPKLLGPGDFCSRLTIGSCCGFNVDCYFGLDDVIEIGANVSVGHDVMFLTRTHSTGDASCRAGQLLCAPIVVEDGAWIASRCTIMPGVTIGAGSVIGASVVVTKDIPPDTLVTGTQTISLARWR